MRECENGMRMMMRDIVNGKDLLEMLGDSVDNIVFELDDC